MVNEKPITLSEVKSFISLQEKEIPFEEALDRVILLNLKYQEALKYISPSISKTERENILKDLNLEDNPKNREMVSKFIIINKYVELVIDPKIYVGEEEVQEYAEKNGIKVEEDSEDFENLKKLIFLKKEREALKEWEERLKREAKIKILN